MPKFERSRLNGVAVIAKTYIHTNILPNLGNTLKKIFFRGDWKVELWQKKEIVIM